MCNAFTTWPHQTRARTVKLDESKGRAALGGLKVQGVDATELQKQILDIAFTDGVREVSDVEKLRWVGERTPHEDRLTGQANTSLFTPQALANNEPETQRKHVQAW